MCSGLINFVAISKMFVDVAIGTTFENDGTPVGYVVQLEKVNTFSVNSEILFGPGEGALNMHCHHGTDISAKRFFFFTHCGGLQGQCFR